MAYLRYFIGSMYTGKSSSATNLLLSSPHPHRYILSPTAAARGFVSRLHKLADLPSSITLVSQLEDLPLSSLPSTTEEATLLFMDEVQFIDHPLFWQILESAKEHPYLDIILAGLNYDQHAIPFANAKRLTSLFTKEYQEHLYVSCATCSSDLGEVSIRKWLTQNRITDDYAVLCMSCFKAFFTLKNHAQECAICKAPESSYQLPQWRSDDPTLDTQAALCNNCYKDIHTFHDHFKLDHPNRASSLSHH